MRTLERLEADGIADLAHARRISMARDRPLDDLEDGELLVAEALASPGLGLLAAGGLAHESVLLSPPGGHWSSNVGGPWWGVGIETVSGSAATPQQAVRVSRSTDPLQDRQLTA
jgi:hypothetical protein